MKTLSYFYSVVSVGHGNTGPSSLQKSIYTTSQKFEPWNTLLIFFFFFKYRGKGLMFFKNIINLCCYIYFQSFISAISITHSYFKIKKYQSWQWDGFTELTSTVIYKIFNEIKKLKEPIKKWNNNWYKHENSHPLRNSVRWTIVRSAVWTMWTIVVIVKVAICTESF